MGFRGFWSNIRPKSIWRSVTAWLLSGLALDGLIRLLLGGETIMEVLLRYLSASIFLIDYGIVQVALLAVACYLFWESGKKAVAANAKRQEEAEAARQQMVADIKAALAPALEKAGTLIAISTDAFLSSYSAFDALRSLDRHFTWVRNAEIELISLVQQSQVKESQFNAYVAEWQEKVIGALKAGGYSDDEISDILSLKRKELRGISDPAGVELLKDKSLSAPYRQWCEQRDWVNRFVFGLPGKLEREIRVNRDRIAKLVESDG